ncbi:TPA: IS630 family transposase, partial [Neisseria meningitidis]
DYQRVYLDETGFDRYLFRPYARSLKGQIVKAQISGKRYSGLTKIRTRRRSRRQYK